MQKIRTLETSIPKLTKFFLQLQNQLSALYFNDKNFISYAIIHVLRTKTMIFLNFSKKDE